MYTGDRVTILPILILMCKDVDDFEEEPSSKRSRSTPIPGDGHMPIHMAGGLSQPPHVEEDLHIPQTRTVHNGVEDEQLAEPQTFTLIQLQERVC